MKTLKDELGFADELSADYDVVRMACGAVGVTFKTRVRMSLKTEGSYPLYKQAEDILKRLGKNAASLNSVGSFQLQLHEKIEKLETWLDCTPSSEDISIPQRLEHLRGKLGKDAFLRELTLHQQADRLLAQSGLAGEAAEQKFEACSTSLAQRLQSQEFCIRDLSQCLIEYEDLGEMSLRTGWTAPEAVADSAQKAWQETMKGMEKIESVLDTLPRALCLFVFLSKVRLPGWPQRQMVQTLRSLLGRKHKQLSAMGVQNNQGLVNQCYRFYPAIKAVADKYPDLKQAVGFNCEEQLQKLKEDGAGVVLNFGKCRFHAWDLFQSSEGHR